MALVSEADAAPFCCALAGEALEPPPIWLMRQAGRYLPEYRAMRAKRGGFLDLCYTPDLAAEVTLQPIRRFGFDAAILFSDILRRAGCAGPEACVSSKARARVSMPIRTERGTCPLERGATRAQVRAASSRRWRGLRQDLPHETALIGFCGAPWTVATYMVAGRARRIRPTRGCGPIAIPKAFSG